MSKDLTSDLTSEPLSTVTLQLTARVIRNAVWERHHSINPGSGVCNNTEPVVQHDLAKAVESLVSMAVTADDFAPVLAAKALVLEDALAVTPALAGKLLEWVQVLLDGLRPLACATAPARSGAADDAPLTDLEDLRDYIKQTVVFSIFSDLVFMCFMTCSDDYDRPSPPTVIDVRATATECHQGLLTASQSDALGLGGLFATAAAAVPLDDLTGRLVAAPAAAFVAQEWLGLLDSVNSLLLVSECLE